MTLPDQLLTCRDPAELTLFGIRHMLRDQSPPIVAEALSRVLEDLRLDQSPEIVSTRSPCR